MIEPEARQRGLQLMQAVPFVFVATVGPGQEPDIRAMNNLKTADLLAGWPEGLQRHRKDFVTFLSTLTSSRKMAQLRENPAASLYYCQTEFWKGLTLEGKLEEVLDQEIKQALWQQDWTRYYPGGVSDPSYSILRFVPRQARYYERLALVQFDV